MKTKELAEEQRHAALTISREEAEMAHFAGLTRGFYTQKRWPGRPALQSRDSFRGRGAFEPKVQEPTMVLDERFTTENTQRAIEAENVAVVEREETYWNEGNG